MTPADPQSRAELVAAVAVGLALGAMPILAASLLGWWPRLARLGWACVALAPLWLWTLWRDWRRAR